MKLATKLIKGAALLSLGQVTGYALAFIRNLILARLLTKADFGLAAALSMAISLLELVSQMAFGRQIVQAHEGDEPVYQSVAHGVQVFVGLISATLVVLAAWPMALAFHHPELIWAFASLAIVPLARGFLHLDLARLQRQLTYGPQVIADVVPQVLATVAAWPLAVWLRDFRAVLYIMLGKEVLAVALSHLLAKRPYRWAWRGELVASMWAFGWPLLLNGMVMFGAQQGDQMVIGAAFSMAELASYSVAFTLSSVPFFILGQVVSSLILPVLARHQNNPAEFQRQYRMCLEVTVVGALVVMGPLIVAGDGLVRTLYGSKYAGTGSLMAIFGGVVALRFFRLAPSFAAMSKADTINQLYGNIARAVSLPIALLLIGLGTRSVPAVAACGLVGEALAIAVTLYRVRTRLHIGFRPHLAAIVFLVGWVITAAALNLWVGSAGNLWLQVVAALLLVVGGIAAARFLFPDLSNLAVSTLRASLRGALQFSVSGRAGTRSVPEGD